MVHPALSERNSVRISVALLALSMYAVMFDQWWHAVFSRDAIFIPPHYFVYGMSGLLVLFSWYTWRRFKKPSWKRLGILMTLLPVSAPFDAFWHAWFGYENANSVWVAWSPPHVALALMFIAAQYTLFRLVQLYETDRDAKKLLSLLLIALFFSSTTFLLIPVQPLFYFHIFGLYGFLLTLPVMVSLLIFARREFGFAAATLLTLFFHARVFAGSGESFSAYAPFTPPVISVAPALLAALILDAMPARAPIFTQAGVYALVLAVAKIGAFFLFSIGLYDHMNFSLRIDYVQLLLVTVGGCLIGGALLYFGDRLYTRHLLAADDPEFRRV